jgi:imidazoleglycerol-phosphate dehydratase/histidinol-phosphatase
MSSAKRRILFLDRDGTLIIEPEDQQIDSLEKLELVEGVIPALLRLKDAGYEFVIVSNQDGLGTASNPTEKFQPPHDKMLSLFFPPNILTLTLKLTTRPTANRELAWCWIT